MGCSWFYIKTLSNLKTRHKLFLTSNPRFYIKTLTNLELRVDCKIKPLVKLEVQGWSLQLMGCL